jgi:hypothetical protein
LENSQSEGQLNGVFGVFSGFCVIGEFGAIGGFGVIGKISMFSALKDLSIQKLP